MGDRETLSTCPYNLDPLSYFSFQPVLHDWFNKCHGMCYPVCGMVHIKEPLLLIGKSSLCGGSGFPLSLSECAHHKTKDWLSSLRSWGRRKKKVKRKERYLMQQDNTKHELVG